MTIDEQSWAYANSTGLGFTEGGIVAAHFEACRPWYRRSLDRAGVRPGQRVLDAGSGAGSFLPWLAAAIGPAGHITALDLAPENVTALRARVLDVRWTVPIEVVRGDVTALPFPDASFDTVWCANTLQYLDDVALGTALGELRRVLRPGGVLAVKELDPGTIAVRPGNRFVVADYFRAAAAGGDRYAGQLMRSSDLYRWVSAAGFRKVRQETDLAQHFAPFPDPVGGFYRATCAALAPQALALGQDRVWAAFADVTSPENPLNAADASIVEGLITVIAER